MFFRCFSASPSGGDEPLLPEPISAISSSLTLSSLTRPRRGSAASCVPVFFIRPALNSNSVKSSHSSSSCGAAIMTKRTEQVNIDRGSQKNQRKKRGENESEPIRPFTMSSGGPFRKFSLSDVSTQNSVKSSVQRGIRGAAIPGEKEACFSLLLFSISNDRPPCSQP